MRALVTISIAAALTAVASVATAATATAAPTLTPLDSITACPAGTRADRPVLLIHGTNATVEQSLGPVRTGLLDDGRCVYGLEYDSRQSISVSVDYFEAAVDRILAVNQAAAIDLLGKSQGGLIARAVSLEFAGRQVNPIKKVVAISGPQHGVTLSVAGLDVTALATQLPVLADRMPAAADMLAGSPYLTQLNKGPMTAPGVEYTMIASRYDDIIKPYTSSFVDAPKVTNLTVQDGCPEDHTGHIAASNDPRTIDLALRAMDPQRHPTLRCTATDER
jgi:triacylglycerol esterase/lipase EstA (alpha/beta hydrolase family)